MKILSHDFSRALVMLKKMASGWSGEATQALLGIWGKQNVQSQLDGVARNRNIYEKIAESLSGLGYEYSWKQCRTKIKNLTGKLV